VLLDKLAAEIQSSLRPVQPLPGRRALTAALVLICALVALGGAARAGFFGLHALGLAQRVTILVALSAVAWLTAREVVSYWIPGSRHYLGAGAMVTLVSVTLLALFALLFHDFHVEHFVSAGIVCLGVGVLHAIPTACVAAWLLRRGFVLEHIPAGAISGALGGIAGVTMLELHCPNLEAAHVLVWHGAVVPVSAALGALVGWAVRGWRGSH
jgi:hypothetical protein